MKKIFLLPHSFKKVGWAILIPTFIIGLMMFVDGCNGFPTYLLKGIDPASGLYRVLTSNVMIGLLNNIAIIGISVGSLFVVCSREPHHSGAAQLVAGCALFEYGLCGRVGSLFL